MKEFDKPSSESNGLVVPTTSQALCLVPELWSGSCSTGTEALTGTGKHRSSLATATMSTVDHSHGGVRTYRNEAQGPVRFHLLHPLLLTRFASRAYPSLGSCAAIPGHNAPGIQTLPVVLASTRLRRSCISQGRGTLNPLPVDLHQRNRPAGTIVMPSHCDPVPTSYCHGLGWSS